MLSLREVTVDFDGFVAVDHVGLDLAQGRVLAVLGPSGCGKSTLLRAIAGLEDLSEGAVAFDGQDLAGVATHRRGFALMFQDGQLFAQQSVADNVGYALRLRSVPAARRRRKVGELLDLVGLADAGAHRVSSLSGGEQQRVALARALAAEPRLLLLDEPLSALDRELRERLARDVRDILAATGTTALLVTHDHDEACAMADDLAVMMRGQVVQHGTTRQVWREPADAQTARFLGYLGIVRGSAARRVVDTALAASPDHREQRLLSGWREQAPARGLAMRRSALHYDQGPLSEGDTGSATRLVGRVSATGLLSDILRLRVEIEGVGTFDAVAPHSCPVQAGDRVALRVDSDGLAPLPADQPSG